MNRHRLPPAPDGLPRGARLRLLIFDCDGVLFESEEANVAFYDAVLAAEDLPPLDDEGRRLCYVLSGSQLYDRLFGRDPALLQRVRETAKRIDYGPFYGLMRPVPALRETLARLAAHCPLALATNRGRTVSGVLAYFGLEQFFSTRVGILDVARPKPAPDVLLACLERSGVPPQAAAYVGDSEIDRDAARAAGIAYVGVGAKSGACWTVKGIRELPDLLLP